MRIATEADVPALVSLVNLAYRVEDEWINADRTRPDEVLEMMKEGVFLLEGEIDAAIYVSIAGERGYFGMLSVDPAKQKQGLGARMIDLAESYCRERGCKHMDLTVIELRKDLPPFYAKHGYAPNGKEEFPAKWKMRMPFQLLKMTKPL
jgi:GNAT superfamily N-acetyltransferase